MQMILQWLSIALEMFLGGKSDLGGEGNSIAGTFTWNKRYIDDIVSRFSEAKIKRFSCEFELL